MTLLQRTLVPPPLELVALAVPPELVAVEVAVTEEPTLPAPLALPPPVTEVYVVTVDVVPPVAEALLVAVDWAMASPVNVSASRQQDTNSFEIFIALTPRDYRQLIGVMILYRRRLLINLFHNNDQLLEPCSMSKDNRVRTCGLGCGT